MARVLAISSQVARGAIGLSAAVPALQALGHEVVALPTILLSNHPGHAHVAGERVAPILLRRMLDALETNGWLSEIDAVLTGYLPSSEHVDLARNAIDRVRGANPRTLHVCDPILGDEPKGLYIAPEAAQAIRDTLVPNADVLKMNRFECGWLTGEAVASSDDVQRVARARSWPTTIVTSLQDGAADVIGNVHVEASGPMRLSSVAACERAPHGTGDLMGGLYLGHRLSGRKSADAFTLAVAGVEVVIGRSRGADELQVASCLRDLPR